MPKLTIYFRELFFRTVVIVRINGAEVYRDTLTTRMQIGLAGRVSIEVDPRRVHLEIELPAIGQKIQKEIEVINNIYAAVDLDEHGRAMIHVQKDDFRFL